MNILIVSNLYPPHHQGGYELRCQQVAEHLLRQGHDVRVVTSSYQIRGTTDGVCIQDDCVNNVRVARFLRQHRLEKRRRGRRLYNADVVRRQIADATRFSSVLNEFRPDLISWWNLEGITKTILGVSLARHIPSVCWIEDNWMIREFGANGDVDSPFWYDFWQARWGPRALRPVIRTCLAPFEGRVRRRGIPTRAFGVPPCHVCFISEFWRFRHERAGLRAESSEVIYGGVCTRKFFAKRSPADYMSDPLRLLYAGFVDRARGLDTIIEAIGLIPRRQRERIQLSVAFPGPVSPDQYMNGIVRRIAELDLGKHVTILGRISHDEMPSVYARHQVLVFASTRSEGMPMVMMEAMCSGCAVVHTGSGGAIELGERANAPLFPKDHPFALSRLLSALEQDRARVAEIARRGQETVLREFTLDRMLERACEALRRTGERGQDSVREMAFKESRNQVGAGDAKLRIASKGCR